MRAGEAVNIRGSKPSSVCLANSLRCQSPRIVETFLCSQPLTEAGPVVVFVVDRALEAAHAV